MRLKLAEGIKITLATYFGFAGAIKLDYSVKRVYWLKYFDSISDISSCDYGGRDKKTIAREHFKNWSPTLLKNSLYLLNARGNSIIQRNISNGNISRKIQINGSANYNDIIAVHHSVQPTGE